MNEPLIIMAYPKGSLEKRNIDLAKAMQNFKADVKLNKTFNNKYYFNISISSLYLDLLCNF